LLAACQIIATCCFVRKCVWPCLPGDSDFAWGGVVEVASTRGIRPDWSKLVDTFCEELSRRGTEHVYLILR
jgi:hypothetical protein